MAQDHPEEDHFLSALRSFASRTCYANASGGKHSCHSQQPSLQAQASWVKHQLHAREGTIGNTAIWQALGLLQAQGLRSDASLRLLSHDTTATFCNVPACSNMMLPGTLGHQHTGGHRLPSPLPAFPRSGFWDWMVFPIGCAQYNFSKRQLNFVLLKPLRVCCRTMRLSSTSACARPVLW